MIFKFVFVFCFLHLNQKQHCAWQILQKLNLPPGKQAKCKLIFTDKKNRAVKLCFIALPKWNISIVVYSGVRSRPPSSAEIRSAVVNNSEVMVLRTLSSPIRVSGPETLIAATTSPA